MATRKIVNKKVNKIMLQLPNNCRAGNMFIHPENYNTANPDMETQWRISYWFYDDNLGKKKLIVLKAGINRFDTAGERKNLVDTLINDEKKKLQELGFNRITGQYFIDTETDISEFVPLPDALEWALQGLKLEPRTKQDIGNYLKHIKKAIAALNYDNLSIGQVKRKHVRILLEKCGTGKTANQFNVYRKYLSILFKALVEVEAIDTNPIREISKRKQLKKIRVTLTKEERVKISKHLHDKYYTFWRFLQIFFHSGARITELLNLRKADVEIDQQRFKVIVKKGGQTREEYRVIKTIALPFWNEILSEAEPGNLLLSTKLKPGNKVIRIEQISRRWRHHVKNKFDIKADFYSLKHTNLDEVADILGIKEAQAMAGHSTPVITMTYAVGEKERKLNKLKGADNAF